MENIKLKVASTNWQEVAEEMHDKGFALIPKLLTDEQCTELIHGFDNSNDYRKTVIMERYRFGLGEYKYFNYPLPDLIHTIRTSIYTHLAPIANAWMKVLNIDTHFPLTHQELLQQCHDSDQSKATVLILKYGKGGYNTLHQDLYGEVYFPIQTVLFLNEPDEDYTGGEFVLTEQTPRAQSKAIVF
jgi:hypothetical protein